MDRECDRFELEIGMRQHGALDAREEAALAAHLATCESCRAFARATGDGEAALKRQVDAELAQVDWRALHRGVERLQRSYRLKLWLAPLFILQVPLIFLLGLGHLPPRELLAASPATVFLYVAWVWLVNRPFREVMAVVKSGDELLVGYMRELRRQRLRARVFSVIYLFLAVPGLALAFGGDGLRLRLYGVGCAVLFGALVAYELLAKLPRLRRALAEAGQ